jgi:P-type conjugative transfer protein TrbJ
MKKLSIVTLGCLLAAFTLPARAQWVVIDPANLLQTTITALRTLQQIENQIQQLANEAQMLENEAKNLKSLNFSSLSQLQATLATTNQLLAQAQGVSFTLARAQQQFAQFYPASYRRSMSQSQMASDALQRLTNSQNALQSSISIQAQSAQNFSSDQSVLASLVNQSQSAGGTLQATQATNQILALQVRQAVQDQQLRVTQDRATALEQARAVAAEARARAVRLQFTAPGANYTPQPVQFYGP